MSISTSPLCCSIRIARQIKDCSAGGRQSCILGRAILCSLRASRQWQREEYLNFTTLLQHWQVVAKPAYSAAHLKYVALYYKCGEYILCCLRASQQWHFTASVKSNNLRVSQIPLCCCICRWSPNPHVLYIAVYWIMPSYLRPCAYYYSA